ncbi:acyl carrier protein [Catenulispora pinisilvae]|uniref:acyl carrier protein n=1 Tax=Catenulispora pinisilvae TaxID=2705253 RepID=UPI0018918DE5|nr:acyl carrier protein [Catenulispora pinisilvae]
MPQSVTDRVIALAAEVFQRPVTVTDSFFDLGGDSLMAVELCILIEEWAGQPVDIGTLMQAENIGAFSAHIAQLVAEPR